MSMVEGWTCSLPNGYMGWLNSEDNLDQIWHEAAPMLQRAIDHNRGEFHLDDIRTLIEGRLCTLWCIANPKGELVAAVVVEVVNYPRFKVMRILLVGGEESKSWKDLWPALEHYARVNGCAHIEAFTRPGMERLFGLTGMKRVYTVISTPVSYEELH